jgi:HK97 family phage prohead protease
MFRSGIVVARSEVAGKILRGHAAIFDVPTVAQAQFPGTETIARGAFTKNLSEDVRMTVDHNSSMLLGRTSSGTLRLAEDASGLYFECELPNTQLGNDVRELVARGDLCGASFMAAVDRSTMERTDDGVVHRSFARLIDVCVTAAPAYVETDVALRTAAEHTLRAQLAAIRARVFLKGML